MEAKYEKDLVSVITPAYNSEKYIMETIESVINQSYTKWEMIIVDDNSNDKTADIVRTYAENDTRIKLIQLQNNCGAGIARNIAIECAKGEYIAFIDADDTWSFNKIEVQLKYMKEKKCAFSFTEYEYMKKENKEYKIKNKYMGKGNLIIKSKMNISSKKEKKIFKVPEKLTYKQALKKTVIGCLTVMIDRNIVGEFYMSRVRKGQDNVTWLNLLKKGYTAYGIQENLAQYRRVDGSLSHNKLKALKRQWNNYRKEIKLPFFTCLYYYVCYVFTSIKKYVLE